MKQTITWTALPNCSVELSATDSLVLSVHISPRLEPEGGSPLLQAFPDFNDWPAALQDVTFKVFFRNGPTVVGKMKTAPKSEIWQAVFPGAQTRVKQFTFKAFQARPIKSFQVAKTLDEIKDICIQHAVTTPVELPRPADLRKTIEKTSIIKIPAAMSPKIQSQQPGGFGTPAPSASGTQQVRAVQPSTQQPIQTSQIAQTAPLAASLKLAEAKRVALPTRTQIAEQIDFHAACGSLGSYPELMRLLGLVIELELNVSANQISAKSVVRVVPEWAPKAGANNNRDFSPWTRYQIVNAGSDKSKSYFIAEPKPRGSDLRPSGLLGLDSNDYHIVEVDVDGAALKMAGAIQTLAKAQPKTTENDTTDGLPSLTTAGVTVARDKRSEIMKNALNNSKLLNDALTRALSVRPYKNETALELYMDDVTRGFRVDIQEGAGSWRSLCQRTGTYTVVSNGQKFDLEDEGFVQSAATSAADDQSANAPIFLHETLFRWAGWSLSAPRPGKTIMPDGTPGVADGNEGALHIKTVFKPKQGSLPKLRFGKKYRLRARIVDLAGNSVPLGTADGSITIPPARKPAFTYQRYEPVASPVLVPRLDVDNIPGESVARLAIRTNNVDSRTDTSVLPTTEFRETFIVPPRTSEIMAETHGMFDTLQGGLYDQYGLISEMDQSLPSINPAELLKLPYLPDPLAKGVVFCSFSGPPPAMGPESKWQPLLFKGDWPRLNPFRLRIVDGPKVAVEGPAGPDQSMVLTVRLPKAEILTLRVSSLIPDTNKLELMGPYKWLKEAGNVPAVSPAIKSAPVRVLHAQQSPGVRPAVTPGPAQARPQTDQQSQVVRPVQQTSQFVVPANLKAVALSVAQESRHWLLTPYREVVLVHAVQQPIGRPQIGDNMKPVKKSLGDTYAMLVGDLLDVHKKSTGKIDMVAEWEETVDDVTQPLPQDGENAPKIPRQAHVFSEIIEYPRDNGTKVTLNKRHDFGDTKYRPVNYTVISTTRFRDYFSFTDEDIDSEKVSITRTSARVKARDVPSSARPDAPKVVCVLPLFKWQKGPGTSKRQGGAVRVYVERPWYSSGANEMLAVVLAPDDVRQLSDEAAQLMTVWGTDPIWKSGAIPYYPSIKQFPNAVIDRTLSLPDQPANRKVDVAAFRPHYDKTRQLWFFDVEIDRTYPSYFPFLRLALARYQPISLRTATTDYKLSKVVTAEYIQLAPDRTLSVAKQADGIEVALSHGGLKADGANPREERHQVWITIEQQTGKGDLGWAPTTMEPVRLAEQPAMKAWRGKIKLPSVTRDAKLRVVAKEYEVFPPDGERLVYAGTVEL